MNANTHTFSCMGTRCTIAVPSRDVDSANEIQHKLKHELFRIQHMLSWFSPNSELFQLNRHAHISPVKVSKELFNLVEYSIEFHKTTNGYFDLTTRSFKHAPNETMRSELVQYIGMNKLVLDNKEQSIFFKNEYIDLDLGAIGKGYALDCLGKILQNHSIKHAFISLGDSSILGYGTHPAGDSWPVGLAKDQKSNPNLSGNDPISTFNLYNESLSISESYRYNQNSLRVAHNHIFNPKTGSVIDRQEQVIVQHKSALIAEFWSTSLLSMPKKEQAKFLENYPKDTKIWINTHNNIA